MKKYFVLLVFSLLVVSAGCGQQSETPQGQAPEASSMGKKMDKAKQSMAKTAEQAIELSRNLEQINEQKDYLISQAEGFYNSEDFQQVVEVAQYVIQYLDKDSVKAKDLLNKAKAELEKMAKDKVNEVTQSLGGFGN